MSKTETSKSTIYREHEPVSDSFIGGLIDSVVGNPGLHTTQIHDKESGKWGKGYGNTQAEADQAARDDLADKRGR